MPIVKWPCIWYYKDSPRGQNKNRRYINMIMIEVKHDGKHWVIIDGETVWRYDTHEEAMKDARELAQKYIDAGVPPQEVSYGD